MRKTVENFIKEHKHINYCEAVIHKDGLVEYVRPSHVETLVRITGESKDVINSKMPIWESPIHWLTEYSGCISVWAGFYIKPKNITEEQKYTLQKLIEAKLVDDLDRSMGE